MIFPGVLFSQKLSKKVDQFTSKTSVMSEDRTLASVFPIIGSKKPWDLVMSFSLLDKDISFVITHQSQSYSSIVNSISFKFEDGTVIVKNGPGNSGDYNTGLGYKYTFSVFSLTKDELAKFASSNLSLVSADFNYFPDSPTIQSEIKKKSVGLIINDAKAILKEWESMIIKSDGNEKKYLFNCKVEYDQVDEFTNIRKTISSPALIFEKDLGGMFFYLNVSGTKINNHNGLRFIAGFKVSDDMVKMVKVEQVKQIIKYNQISLLLEDGKVISFKDAELNQYVSSVNNYQFYKFYNIENDSIANLLKTIPLKKVRILLDDKEVETLSVIKDGASAIINVLNCTNSL